MSSPFTQAQLKTPKGFEHLLEGLCKEVLRRQPENILEFATEHFSRLMKLREETGYDGYTPKAEIELESQEAIAVEEVPVLLEPEEPAAEDRGAVGETQDDAPEAEQTATAPEEARPADEITAEQITEEARIADEITAEQITEEARMADEITAETRTAEQITEEARMADEITAETRTAEQITEEARIADEITAETRTAEQITEEARITDEITAETRTAEQITEEARIADEITEETRTADEITEEARTADEITAEAGTESERPESEKAEPISSLPEAEASVDEVIAASAQEWETGPAAEGERVPGYVTQDTEPSTEAQGTAENETVKEQSPSDSKEVTVDPASTELPASDGDSD